MDLNESRKLMRFMVETTKEAGDLTQRMFGNHGKVEIKTGPLDVVTEADKETDKLFTRRITDEFPDHGIISEELPAYNANKDFVWIIDPIDGTLNYYTGIDSYAIIVGLRHKGEMIMSCVLNPVNRQMYVTELGKGVLRNGVPVKCSPQTEIQHSIGLTNDKISLLRMDIFQRMIDSFGEKGVWIGSNGCTGVNCGLVADGRKHWYICSGGGGIWDYAGTVLLLKESGCLVTDLEGKEWKHGAGPFIAANPILHKKLVDIMTKGKVLGFPGSRD